MDMRTKTTIYFGDEDRENIAILKEKHGDMTDAEAVRLALRMAAKLPKPRNKKREGGETEQK